jgi:hypothetical protein
MSNPQRECKDCTYYDVMGHNPDEPMGHCKRYPPVIDPAFAAEDEENATESPCTYVWPIVDADQWCGEWHV